MNHTEAYLLHLRNDRVRRLAACFLGYLTLALLGSILSYLYCRSSPSQLPWLLIHPSGASPIRSAILGQAIPALMLAVLFFSAYTMFHIPAAAVICLIRGASIGCIGAMGNRITGQGSGWYAGLMLYLAANVLLSLTAAVCSIYSDGINHAHWAGDGRYARSLTLEFLRIFLMLAGVFFLVGMGSQLILI